MQEIGRLLVERRVNQRAIVFAERDRQGGERTVK